MESLWLYRDGKPKLIIFCNGWGMDERPFRSILSEQYDVLMLSDYRSLSAVPDIPSLARDYAAVFLVSWSMGVWAGQRLFYSVRDYFTEAVAINGTLCPIHDKLGIPEEILLATLDNFSDDSRQKLYRRMCRDQEHCGHFLANLPGRSLASQRQELQVLLAGCDCRRAEESLYSQVMIADRDRIMPTANQLEFWQAGPYQQFAGQHFPFYRWPSWDVLVAEAFQSGFSARPAMTERA